MFYKLEVEDHVRVEPRYFGLPTREAIEQQLNEDYVGKVNKELGYVVAVLSIGDIDDGVLIPGDGAAYYRSQFEILVWKPVLHEIVYAVVSDIANFGAFVQVGPAQGVIHISQTMEDYVTLSKSGVFTGRSTKRTLSKGDECIARIVAISYKADTPKISLTMRQQGLGKLQWLEEEKRKKENLAKKPAAKSKKKGGKK
ncbi:DNA-directed RNA polymerase [Candidatus Pacearchaeota archaeon]|nr:MAG: DNA-directed RNA polymerase [Candidatus Pacearchaeota archaeon]